jgi:hypothetical protein
VKDDLAKATGRGMKSWHCMLTELLRVGSVGGKGAILMTWVEAGEDPDDL